MTVVQRGSRLYCLTLRRYRRGTGRGSGIYKWTVDLSYMRTNRDGHGHIVRNYGSLWRALKSWVRARLNPAAYFGKKRRNPGRAHRRTA